MSRQDSPSLGDQELMILAFVSELGGATVREVVDHFSSEQGLARTTIFTVLERLRQKGYLRRRKSGAVYRYQPATEQSAVLKNIVEKFIEKRLGGSISPLLAYLADARDLTSDEIAQLRRLLSDLNGVEQ